MYQKFKIKEKEVTTLIFNDNISLKDYRKFLSQCKHYCDSIIVNNVYNNNDFLEQVIDASILEENWFPSKELGKFDVFISHSHKDINHIKKFAFWLERELGLRCFIDSVYWECVNNILFETKCYCNDLKKNISLHIYVILSIAIMKMINQTECIIFVDSRNSLIRNKRQTLSPWIYEELCFIDMLPQISPRRKGRISSARGITYSEFIQKLVTYNVNIDGLKPLNAAILNGAKDSRKRGEDALDYIYAISDGKRRIDEQ